MAQLDMPEEDKERLTTEAFTKKYLEITNTKKNRFNKYCSIW